MFRNRVSKDEKSEKESCIELRISLEKLSTSVGSRILGFRSHNHTNSSITGDKPNFPRSFILLSIRTK